MKVAKCDWCGSTDVYFDSWVDINGGLVSMFENAYCAGECEGDIGYGYEVMEEMK